MKGKLLFLGLFGAISPIAFSQGTFQNLDFEAANLTPIPAGQFGGEVPIANGLPGWTGYFGTVQQSQVVQNNVATGSASIDILGPNYGGGIIDGSYSVLLQAGLAFPGNFASATIAQTGTVPANAQSLQFKAWNNGQLSVSFAGNSLAVFPISTGTGESVNYTLYGVNIAPYEGDVGQLSFSSTLGNVGLDDISFSPNAVPEPPPFVFSGMAGLLFVASRRLSMLELHRHLNTP